MNPSRLIRSAFWLIILLAPLRIFAMTCTNGAINPATPDANFTINSDGTATDHKSGLTSHRYPQFSAVACL